VSEELDPRFWPPGHRDPVSLLGHRRYRRGELVKVSVFMPREFVNFLDEMVKRGIYLTRGEAIRDAVARMIREKMFNIYMDLAIPKKQRIFTRGTMIIVDYGEKKPRDLTPVRRRRKKN